MKYITILAVTLLSFLAIQSANAHCQVPCGIFGDELKFSEFEQHVETIAKASRLINELSAKETLTAKDHQQLIRWTITKEEHASKLIAETGTYFLAQRVKVGADHYSEKIELLHHIIVFSMKTKQSTDGEAIATLSEKIAAFKELYLDHDHTQHAH
jgi:nickel superoxide dismutase